MLKIKRYYTPLGTFGEFEVDNKILWTVERPWLENKQRVSCIPEGIYRCRPRYYNRGNYPAIEISNVPGRYYILFHVGNTPSNVQGCIAVTSKLGTINGQWGGYKSKKAFGYFMKRYGNKEFQLEIEQFKIQS